MIIILASVGVVVLAGGVGYAIWRQPKDPKVYASKAADFLKEGKYESAAYNYHIAADVSKDDAPEKPGYYLSWAKVLLEWRQKDETLGKSAKDKNLGEALGALRRAMLFDPKFIEAQRLLTEWEYRLYWRRDYKECIATTGKLLKLVPDDHKTLHKRASAYMQLAKEDPESLKSATKDFQRLVEIAGDQEIYWLRLIQAYLASQEPDRYEQAAKTYEEAIETNKDSASLRINYAQFLLQRKHNTEALKLLHDTADPKFGAVGYLALASYYRQKRDLDQAVLNYKKAIEVEPTDYRGYSELSQIYTMRKEQAEAEVILKKGLDAIRKSKKADLKGAKLQNYRVGIVLLDHRLCDILLDGLKTSSNKEKTIQTVRDMLKEMQDASADDSVFAWFHDPHIAKIEGRLVLVDDDLPETEKLLKAEKLLRRAYDSFRMIDGRAYIDPTTANLLIVIYKRLDQPGESQKIVSRFEKINKENTSVLMAMMRLHIDSRQYKQARRSLQTMLEKNRTEALVSIQVALDAVMGRGKRIPSELKNLDPLAVQLFRRRAHQLWLQGEQESAIRMLSDILSRQPKDLNVMVQMITWHKMRKEIAQANKILALASRVYKDNPRVLKQLSLLMETDPDKRLEQYLAMASTESDPVRKALRKADVYRSFGKEKEFLEYLAVAEGKDPENPTVIRQRFAYALIKSDWEKARKYADAAAKNNLDAVGGVTFRAKLAFQRKQWDEAIGFLQEALRVRPRFSLAHSLMGDCYIVKGEIEQAKKQYEAAHSQNPSNISALKGMIYVSTATGNAADYARWVKQAYKFAPQDTRIREAYLRLQSDPEEVIKYREQTARTQPKNLVNLSHLAMLYEQTGRISQSEKILRTMVNISGGNPVMIRTLAEFLRRRKRDVEARTMLAEYAAKATDKVAAYLVWGGYLEKGGESEQAEAVYKKAVATDPKDSRGYLGTARFNARHRRWLQAAENQQKYIQIEGEETSPQERKHLIAYLINAKKLDDAEKKIDQRLQKDRTDVEMLTLKALIYLNRKDYTKAKEILDNTLKIRSDYVPALVRRADVHLAEGNMDLAVADLESAKRLGAASIDVVRLAGLYEKMNRVDDAISVLQGLLSDDPQNDVILKLLSNLYKRSQRWSSLERILDVGKKAYPNDMFYPRSEAEMWLRRKVPSRAVAILTEAAKRSPNDTGVAFFRMSALVEADMFDDAIAAGKKLRSNKDIAPSVMAVMAMAMAKSNRHSAADAEFASAVKSTKSNKQLLFVLQQVRRAYPPAQAVEKLKLLLKIKPDNPHIYHVMGSILAGQKKDIELAVKYLNKALTGIKTDRQKTTIMGRLGLIYFTLGRYDDSLRMYKETLKINPKDAHVLNNLAWLLAHDMNKIDQALPYAQEACKLVPNGSEFLDTYGYVLMRSGKNNEALDALSRSVDIRPMPANRLHLGEVYEKMNRKSDAFRQYQSGWELVKDDPKNKYYRELREAIKRLGGTPGGSAE